MRYDMKKIVLASLLVSQIALADCDIRSASTLTGEHTVGPVMNLIKDKSILGQCLVSFDMTIDGKTYHRDYNRVGFEYQDMLCDQAIERGRNSLLAEVGGRFQTESITVCTDSDFKPTKLKIGDIILESEVGKSKNSKYWKWQGARCRMFQNRSTVDGRPRLYSGVICESDNSETNWLVVDLW